MGNRKYQKSGLEELLAGLAIFGICTALFAFRVVPAWIFIPGLFMGALPAVKGLRQMVREREVQRLESRGQAERLERSTQRSVLEIASRNRGVVTPVALALAANLAIEEADRFLQDMAARGYAEMNLRDNGTIEYVINELRA